MIKKFYLKVLLLALPFLLMSATYFVFDPFMVLRKYSRYDVAGMYLNEGQVGWDIYMANRDTAGYDSFILGNSCTVAFRAQDWEKHLNGGRSVRIFNNSEGIGAVYDKLNALDRNGANIRNALIILDPDSFTELWTRDHYKYILPPKASGLSEIEYHLKFLQGYLMPNVVASYLEYKITGVITPYMMKKYIMTPHVLREAYGNNGVNVHEAEIKQMGEKYWDSADWVNSIVSTPTNISDPVIFTDQIHCLEKIQRIIKKHGTDMKFVISPHYGIQTKMNPQDVQHLVRIFGKKAVFPLLGDPEFSNDRHDYYETDHYRPLLGIRIMERLYADQ